MIESYSFGRMVIDGREYNKDLMILPPGEIISPWWRISGHELVMADLDELVVAKPGMLVIGTGAYGVMRPAPDLEAGLDKLGIRTVVLPTGKAVDRYNALREGDGGLAACFHLTC